MSYLSDLLGRVTSPRFVWRFFLAYCMVAIFVKIENYNGFLPDFHVSWMVIGGAGLVFAYFYSDWKSGEWKHRERERLRRRAMEAYHAKA